MTPEHQQKLAWLACFVVISVAVTGYFVGLQSPMNPSNNEEQAGIFHQHLVQKSVSTDGQSLGTSVIPATHYREMAIAIAANKTRYRTGLTELKPKADLMQEIEISPEQKLVALHQRELNRAFNGAPPTIPHAVDQISSVSCMACHGEGFQSETLRISKMSHQFLANCTQCHVESNSQQLAVAAFQENTFVGLAAPTGGPRAFPAAPPQIPHSTWMRINCMSCHGLAGAYGIRTTHPWRQNCQQCHAPSSVLDQAPLRTESRFLPPLPVRQ